MATNNDNNLLRAARNTLLDMLMESRGTTYPLADQPVTAAVDMVYYNQPAAICIDYPQPDVTYQVFEGSTPFSRAVVPKSRRRVTLDTEPLGGQSQAFKIVATKRFGINRSTDDIQPPLLSSVLYQVTNIKVGVNINLELTADNTLLDFNERVSLTIIKPQERVFYYLSTYAEGSYIPLSKEVLCEGGDQLVIETTEGLKEDTILSVSMRDPHTGSIGVLKMTVTVMVKPNMYLQAGWVLKNDSGEYLTCPALDYNGRAFIKLQNTQQSVSYRLYLEAVDGAAKPEPETWMSRELYGTGGDFYLPVTGKLTEDIIIRIIARKKSSLPGGAPLKAGVFIPVKPKLITTVTAVTSGDDTKLFAIRLSGAQLGVIYQLYRQNGDLPVGDPVFYHRNLGIGHTRVGGKWIADDYDAAKGMDNWVPAEFVVDSVIAEEDKILIFPIGQVETDTAFYITAKKSTTGFTERLPAVTLKAG